MARLAVFGGSVLGPAQRRSRPLVFGLSCLPFVAVEVDFGEVKDPACKALLLAPWMFSLILGIGLV